MCGFATKKGKFRIREREDLMKTTMKSKRRSRALLLSILCAGVIATFLGGCAEGPYMTAYDTGYSYPTTYYTPSYSYDYYNGYPSSYYYWPTTRYYTRYGTSYYGSYGY